MKKAKTIIANNINNNNITLISNIDNEISIIKLVKRLYPELHDIILDITSTNILYYMSRSIPLSDILLAFNISYSDFELLKLDSELFNACINKIKEQRNNIMEDKLLSNYDNNSDNLKMFSIKGNIPQYRDSYLPQQTGISTITINLDGIGSLDINAGKLQANNPIDITNDNIKE